MKQADMEVTYIDHMGNDLSVVNAARVSFDKESYWENEDAWLEYDEPLKLSDKDAKLIKYLADHEHKSPFNHTFITMRVKAPIFVARQLVKHEYMPWNEVSRRYVDDEPEFYIPKEWRGRPKNTKQGSDGVVESVNTVACEVWCIDALNYYNMLIKDGVAPEQARMVLPLNTHTEWYWSGTLYAWAKMYNLRIDGHAQAETRGVAVQAGNILAELYPVSWKALANYE